MAAARSAAARPAAAAPARAPRTARPAPRPAARPAPRTAPREHAADEVSRGATLERTRANLRAKAHGQRRLSFGVAVIGIAGVLLAGVVGVNVLVLRQNVQLDHASRERTRLRAENANLASQVSAAVSASRIDGLAQRSLGLAQASPEDTTYLDLGRTK